MSVSEPLWTWPELLAATGGELVGAPASDRIDGFGIDSRKLSAGEVFIALPGDLSDRFHVTSKSTRHGHEFVAQAAAAGAAGAIVSEAQDIDVPQLVVADTVDALWHIGSAARARFSGSVVAVTGSSGKTTCKAFVQAALEAEASAGSLNNHLGVPLSLAQLLRDASAAVIEIGTSSAGEIAPLSGLARPDVAVVLNVQNAHIANFTDHAALVAEKCSIAEGLATQGTLVVHDGIAPRPEREGPVLTFGEMAGSDVQLVELTGHRAEYRVRGETILAHVPGGGVHRAMTLAAVLAVCLALGRDPADACSLSDDLVPGGRGDEAVLCGVTLLDDSYNANPASMRAALVALAARPGRRLALLGEMAELGDASERHHRGLRDVIEPLDGAWLVGAGMSAAEAGNVLGRFEAADDALLAAVLAEVQPGDVLLVKGSNTVFWTRGFVSHLKSALSESAKAVE